MSEYPWNETNVTFTWLSSLYNSFKGLSMKQITPIYLESENPTLTHDFDVIFCIKFNSWTQMKISQIIIDCKSLGKKYFMDHKVLSKLSKFS